MAPVVEITTSTKRPREDSLVAVQEKLLREPKSSDLTIQCGGKTWRCQSAILTQRCEFFRAACEESSTRTINLDGDDKESVDMLLLDLYTMEKPVTPGSGQNNWIKAERACIVGDKYQVPGLKASGCDHMLQTIETSLVASAMPLKASGMRGWCYFLKRLWNSNFLDPDRIRKALLEKVVKIANSFMKEKEFQNLLKENADFNSEFIIALVKNYYKD